MIHPKSSLDIVLVYKPVNQKWEFHPLAPCLAFNLTSLSKAFNIFRVYEDLLRFVRKNFENCLTKGVTPENH